MYLVANLGVVIFSIISLIPGGTFGGVGDNCIKRSEGTSGASIFRYLPTKCTYGTKEKVNAF